MSRTPLTGMNLPAESWLGKGREGQDRESKGREREKTNTNTPDPIYKTHINTFT